MILLKRVQIRGFRSIENVEIADPQHCHVLVGRNSSGKSNILRALNLFFTGSVEPGKPLEFARDVFERPSRRQKKRIAIAVDFELPASFNFRKQQAPLGALGRSFQIERTWELDPRRNVVTRYGITANGVVVQHSNDLGPQFLSLVRFRYIPNRTVPSDLLREESEALANSIFRRMKNQKPAQELMDGLVESAGKMLSDAASALTTAGSPMSSPSMATGAISKMLSMSGFQATGAHGGIVQDEQWGAGHQTFFLYQVLRAIDTDYSRYFGWRQGTIWAVEEPESALHRDLETRLAGALRGWANEKASRLQVFVTTHSPVFSMASDSASWISLPKDTTIIKPMSVQQVVRAAEQEGVSSWTHPVLSHPWNPVVLVEGPTDAEVLSHIAQMAGFDRMRFLPLRALDENEEGQGKNAMISYLKKNGDLVKNRLPEAPLVILFDWDVVANEVTRAQQAYGPGGATRVVSMDDTHCDPLLGTDWKGIERFYPPEIVAAAHAAGELTVGFGRPGRPYSVSKDELNRGKHSLRNRILAVGDINSFCSLRSVLSDLQTAIDSARIP